MVFEAPSVVALGTTTEIANPIHFNINSDYWEPPELRLLKRKLARVQCSCTLCLRSQQFHKGSRSLSANTKNQAVEVLITRSDLYLKNQKIQQDNASPHANTRNQSVEVLVTGSNLDLKIQQDNASPHANTRNQAVEVLLIGSDLYLKNQKIQQDNASPHAITRNQSVEVLVTGSDLDLKIQQIQQDNASPHANTRNQAVEVLLTGSDLDLKIQQMYQDSASPYANTRNQSVEVLLSGPDLDPKIQQIQPHINTRNQAVEVLLTGTALPPLELLKTCAIIKNNYPTKIPYYTELPPWIPDEALLQIPGIKLLKEEYICTDRDIFPCHKSINTVVCGLTKKSQNLSSLILNDSRINTEGNIKPECKDFSCVAGDVFTDATAGDFGCMAYFPRTRSFGQLTTSSQICTQSEKSYYQETGTYSDVSFDHESEKIEKITEIASRQSQNPVLETIFDKPMIKCTDWCEKCSEIYKSYMDPRCTCQIQPPELGYPCENDIKIRCCGGNPEAKVSRARHSKTESEIRPVPVVKSNPLMVPEFGHMLQSSFASKPEIQFANISPEEYINSIRPPFEGF